MDLNEYLPMFLAECREHLQELNIAVVRLEEAPEDRETLDAIFRAAHSLKGMSATMGYDGIARLTHAMEDVFELLRQRDELPSAMVDVLLECLDRLSAAVDAIDADGSERIDPDPLIAKLTQLVRQEDAEEAGLPVAAAPAAPAPRPVALNDGERVLTLTVTLAPDAVMPSVRALMILQAAADHGRIVDSTPAEDALDGFEGSTVEVRLASGSEADSIVAAIGEVDDVARVDAREPAAAPAPVVPAATVAPDGQGTPTVTPAAAPRPVAAPAPEERRGKGSSTVRVDADRLDNLMHLMGELVVARTQVESLALADGAADRGLSQALQTLTQTSQALQAMVMQIRMIPVEAVFMRFPRLVRDVAGRLDKKVDLQITGQETELDRTVVDALGDPMVHLVRNALDHGLESPAERLAAGKTETGTLEISARHAGGSIVITVADDGHGVDPARVGARAVERGLIDAATAATLDTAGAVELLFAAGFSTAEQVGDLSGRGVGMDAVREKIRGLGGEVIVTSVTGQGTTAEIRLPLTLAIMSALLVELDGQPFGIPLNRVQRTLRMADQVIRPVAGAKMLVLEDEAIPVRSGHAALTPGATPADDGETHLVLIGSGDRTVALTVSRLVGQVELVTRPLPSDLAAGGAVSGAAVLASGDIVLLADCDAIARTTISPTRKAA